VFSGIFQKTSFVNRLLIFLSALVGIFLICLFLFVQTGYLVDPFHYLAVVTVVYAAIFFIKGLLTFWENTALQRMVIMDGLTGLYAYKYLVFRLEAEFEKARRMKKPFFVVMLDVDFFKKVNDTYGHEQGNHVLVSVAKALKSAVRTYDVAGRYGGEEFMLILFHHDEKDVLQMVERIRTNVEREAHTTDGKTFHVTLSAGICSNQHPGVQTKDDLIQKADEALYLAKEHGRNRIEVASAQKH
jgi:diguanylate cyclase (GGDEF)-like protein